MQAVVSSTTLPRMLGQTLARHWQNFLAALRMCLLHSPEVKQALPLLKQQLKRFHQTTKAEALWPDHGSQLLRVPRELDSELRSQMFRQAAVRT
mmetsp:Transcript_77124/g.127254  ORF Transcript_77124/g.127254 Transcript_77124/m.127254 type:complete len:94 (-) Transcript_77124:109-390(-)